MPKIGGRRRDHGTSEHLRVMAVRRVVEDGERPSEVMRSMGLNRGSIHRWLNTYKESGCEGLKATKAQGPRHKLSERQCARAEMDSGEGTVGAWI